MVLEFFYFLARCTLEVQMWSRIELLTLFHCNVMSVFWAESARKSVGRRFEGEWWGTPYLLAKWSQQDNSRRKQTPKTKLSFNNGDSNPQPELRFFAQLSTQRRAGFYRFVKKYILLWSTVNIRGCRSLLLQSVLIHSFILKVKNWSLSSPPFGEQLLIRTEPDVTLGVYSSCKAPALHPITYCSFKVCFLWRFYFLHVQEASKHL